MTAIAFPFLRLDEHSVAAAPWRVVVAPADEVLLADRLEHWDNATPVILRRSVDVDIAAAARQLEVDPVGLRISVVVSVATGGGRGERCRRIAWAAPLSTDLHSTEVELILTGGELSQNLSLTTEIVFLAADRGGRFSPARAGARLWKDQRLVHLDPDSARFPMETISFRNLLRGLGQDALFYVDGSTGGREADFSSSVRLYLNADYPAFVERASQGDPEVLQLLTAAVLGQLVRPALNDDEFAPEGAPPGSLRHVIAAWIERAFPGHPIGTVRSLLRHDPARFEAALGSLALAEMADE